MPAVGKVHALGRQSPRGYFPCRGYSYVCQPATRRTPAWREGRQSPQSGRVHGGRLLRSEAAAASAESTRVRGIGSRPFPANLLNFRAAEFRSKSLDRTLPHFERKSLILFPFRGCRLATL
jgi:hypothetical protein